MQFKAIVRDAKLSSRGVNIHILGGDDMSTDQLRCYLDEPVMVSIEIIAPESGVIDDSWDTDGELME